MSLRTTIVLLIIGALLLNAVIQMAMKNFRLARLVELHRLEQELDQLKRRVAEAGSAIARLKNPVRLREAGEALGLEPLPLSSFTLLEEQQ
jgi:hypothetical protein